MERSNFTTLSLIMTPGVLVFLIGANSRGNEYTLVLWDYLVKNIIKDLILVNAIWNHPQMSSGRGVPVC